MLDWRLKAFKHWQNQGDDAAPKWAKVVFEDIDDDIAIPKWEPA